MIESLLEAGIIAAGYDEVFGPALTPGIAYQQKHLDLKLASSLCLT